MTQELARTLAELDKAKRGLERMRSVIRDADELFYNGSPAGALCAIKDARAEIDAEQMAERAAWATDGEARR